MAADPSRGSHSVSFQAEAAAGRPRRGDRAYHSRWRTARHSSESRGEMRRAIENVEVACGIPTLMQGYNLEDVARGIDEIMIRQPLGVVAAITPFNFPAMIPFWFLPYAIACGNTFILKPSERVPLTLQRVFELMERWAARWRVESGATAARRGGCAAGSSRGARDQLRWIDARGALHLRASGARQARAVPGRREESRAGAARRGYGMTDASHQRQRVRVCGPAMPGGIGGRHRGRRAEEVPDCGCGSRAFLQSGQRPGRAAGDGPGDHRKQDANRSLIGKGAATEQRLLDGLAADNGSRRELSEADRSGRIAGESKVASRPRFLVRC